MKHSNKNCMNILIEQDDGMIGFSDHIILKVATAVNSLLFARTLFWLHCNVCDFDHSRIQHSCETFVHIEVA